MNLREAHFSYLLNQNIKKKITWSSTLCPNNFHMSFVILMHAHFILLDVCCYFFSLVLLHFRTQARANSDFTHYWEESWTGSQIDGLMRPSICLSTLTPGYELWVAADHRRRRQRIAAEKRNTMLRWLDGCKEERGNDTDRDEISHPAVKGYLNMKGRPSYLLSYASWLISKY